MLGQAEHDVRQIGGGFHVVIPSPARIRQIGQNVGRIAEADGGDGDAVGDHGDGLSKAHVAGQVAGALAFLAQIELFLGDADALLGHNGGAKGRQGVDTAGNDVFNIFHAAGPDQNQQIHDQAGVDAGTQQRNAVFLGDLVQLSGQLVGAVLLQQLQIVLSGRQAVVLGIESASMGPAFISAGSRFIPPARAGIRSWQASFWAAPQR